jgi:hypothetical protein
MILERFLAKKLAILIQNRENYAERTIIASILKKIANICGENWSKSPKTGIITLTPDFRISGRAQQLFSDK